MSLAKLINRKSTGKKSIEDEINKVLRNRPQYTFEEVRLKAKLFYRLVSSVPDGEEPDGDKMNKLFFELFNAVYADKPRKGNVISPSGFKNECERKYYYMFSGVTPTDKVERNIDGRLQRIFDSGTWWHTYIQALLYRAGILTKSEIRIANRRRKIFGHTDGEVIWEEKEMILEIKTMNSYSFSKGKHGVLPDHEYQATIYAKEAKNPYKYICFIYISKDTSEIKVHIMEVRKRTIRIIDEKLDSIFGAVEENIAPDRECHSQTEQRACECAFRSHCFKRKTKK